MSEVAGYDAAYPPTDPPSAEQVVFGYLGGDTPNPWTRAQWASQRARYRVGIWTRSDPAGAAQGTTEGRAAVAAWRALGAPAGTLLVLDLETAVDAAYVRAFDAQVVSEGCKVAAYGSKSTLFQNPEPSGGYFPADITNKPHLYPGTQLTQYEFQTGWDDDEVSASLLSSLWDTRSAAKPPAPPAPQPEEDDVSAATPDVYDVPVSADENAAREMWALYPLSAAGSGPLYEHIPDQQSYSGLQALGAKTAVVSWAWHQALVAKYGPPATPADAGA